MIEHDTVQQFALATQQEELTEIGSLRPNNLENFVGQTVIKNQISNALKALEQSKAQGVVRVLDHVLFSGPPGLGKTSLAGILANEMGVKLIQTSGPMLTKAVDVASILTNLNHGDCLFIDEIHRMPPAVMEILYTAMEDFRVDLVSGSGTTARQLSVPLHPFTLLAATTRSGMITGPLRDRFGFLFYLEFYTPEELTLVVQKTAQILQIDIEANGAMEIARRSRRTPRIAIRLCKRVADFALVRKTLITQTLAKNALDELQVDDKGLDALDRKYLEALVVRFKGGPVGLQALSAMLQEDKDTLEDLVEPYLMQEGYVLRTAQGRVATQQGSNGVGSTLPISPLFR